MLKLEKFKQTVFYHCLIQLHFYRYHLNIYLFSSVQFSRSVMSDSLWPHESQHARPPCPSPAPGIHSNSSPLSWWYHPTISSSISSSDIQPCHPPLSSPSPAFSLFQTSGSFQKSQLFSSRGKSIGVSASTLVLPMNIQDWFPLGWIVWNSLQSKGPSRVVSKITVQKHQFFSAHLSL